VLCLLLPVTSCRLSTKADNSPPYYEQLSNLIGTDKTTVFKKLNITEESKEERLGLLGVYKLPKKQAYLGHSFDVLLYTDQSSDKEELYGFSYRLEYENDSKKAIKSVKTLLKKLTEIHGKPEDDGITSLNDVKDFDKILAKSYYSSNEKWNLTDEQILVLEFHSHYEQKTEKRQQIINLTYRVPYSDPHIENR